MPLDVSLGQPCARPAAHTSRRPGLRLPSRAPLTHGYLGRSQRGEGKFKTVMFLLIFASFIFIGFKTVPAYVAEYQLADKMQEVARFAVVNHQNEEQVREIIFKTMQDLDIPAPKEAITVSSSNSLVTIAVDYRVPVDLLVYQTEMHFSPSSENKSLF